MGIFDRVFGEEEEGYKVVKSLFPTDEEVNQDIEKGRRYSLTLAERYANSAGIPVEEALSAVQTGNSQALLNEGINPDFSSVLTNGYQNGYTPEELQASADNYKRNMETLIKSGDSKDIVKRVLINPFDPNNKNVEISTAIMQDEFSKAAPEEGWFGLASSFVGTIGRGVLIDPVENFMGVTGASALGFQGKSRTGFETYQEIMNEPDVDKKILLARKAAAKAREQGLFGNNSLLYWDYYRTVSTAGVGENEGLWLTADIIAAIPVGKVLTAAKGVTTVSGTSAKLARATDALEVVESTGGKAAANMAMDTALNAKETSVNVSKHSAPSSSSVGSNGMGPTLKPTLQNEVVNDYAETLRNLYKGIYTEDMLATAKANKKVILEKQTSFHVLDIAEKDIGFDNFVVEITMGKDTGLPFLEKASAEKFSKSVGGKVEPYGLNNAGNAPEGYVVKFERNLGLQGLASATDVGALRSNLFDILASPELTSSQELNTILKRGVGKLGAVQTEIVNKHFNVMKKVSKEDNNGINRVLSTLVNENPLDGDWYNVNTFKDKFYLQTGRKPSEEVVEGYLSYYKLSETAWLADADSILKRSTGGDRTQFMGSFDGNRFYRMKALEKGNLPDNKDYSQKFVFDMDTNKVIPRAEFMKGDKKKSLFQIVDIEDAPLINGKPVFYATGSLKTSRGILYNDVMPRVAGGRRSTQNINGYLVSNRKGVDLSDNEIMFTPAIVGAGRTAKELEKMGREANVLLKGLRELEAGNITEDILTGIIRSNNGFNPNIENVADLKIFIDKYGINLSEDLQIVTKDMELPRVGVARFEEYRMGKFKTYNELYSLGARDNSVMYGYGGGKFKTVDPTRAIERDFSKGSNYLSEREYSIKALEGWVKAGVDNKLISNWDEIKRLPAIQQLKKAEIINTPSGRKLLTERRVISNRLSESSEFNKMWDRRMASFGEYIFDKTGVDVIDYMSARPDVFLRSMAFNMKLGMFNPDQLIVQASSALNIMAISPMYGLKAALNYSPMRAAMINPTPENVKTIYKRVSGFIGMTEDEFTESITYLRRSGRFEVNQNIQELSGSYDITRGTFTKVLELGRTPFNEGERIGRLMAHDVAYREFKKTYPGIDTSTDVGYRVMDDFITARSDALTMNMTSSSNAWWQQGFMSLPTQWLGYQAKLMENLFFGRNLSAAEKGRLALGQVVFYGGAGIPLGGMAVNALTDRTSEGINPDAYTFLRYGLVDLALSNATGSGTALSGRLGPGDGLIQIYDGIMDKNIAEVIGGPSLSIAWDTGTSAVQMFGSMIYGDVTLSQYDAIKVARNVSSLDKLAKAYYIALQGEFIDKKGRTLAEGLNPWNAMWNTLGFGSQEVELMYDIRQNMYAESQMIKGVTDRTQELVRLSNDYIREGDLTSAQDVMNQISSLQAPLTVEQRRKVYYLSREGYRTMGESSILQDKKTAQSGLSSQYERLVKGRGQE